MLASPLNYTGGKYKLLPQILPLFPPHIRTFVDLFCGGCNVGLNIDCQTVRYNDSEPRLIAIFRTLQQMEPETALARVGEIIEDYGLSQAERYGYAYYHCESSQGLGDYNRAPFLRLRQAYNQRIDRGLLDSDTDLLLYVLIVYSFNNQLRFNSQGHFNLPVGKRDFNPSMAAKLTGFIQRIRSQSCAFTCRDFRDFSLSGLGQGDFLYADPPYLISCATYNEQGGWNETAERALLDYLDAAQTQGLPFALSNVLRSKGRENQLLLDWLAENQGRYRAIPLNYNYANANYHTKDKTPSSDEVLIVNYEGEAVCG